MSSTSTRLLTPESPCSGRWLAEEAPEEILAVLMDFLAPNCESRGGLR
jgi:hypothetical protein